MARRFYQEIHFQLNELILYYNFPEASGEAKDIADCHHIEKLRCSRSKELTSDECINVRKCELYHNYETLFFSTGLDVLALQGLDIKLRQR